ncbi:MAG: hypothetical protein RBS39_12895 [Phycisphaerales bacterium]|jgi:hypothetical protein|nr:hypothetical protein [Phycisphaerales bacterium]
MSALSRQPESLLRGGQWQADVAQLLDEHHLVAWSAQPRRRLHFAVSLGQFLESQRDVEVCSFYGRFITDIDAFCHQLERAIVGLPLERRVDGPNGIVNMLRSRQEVPGRVPSRYRYYIWHDADILLREDHRLFGQIAEAMAGVAAESEYVSDDLLLIHRSIYVGGPMLDVYAEDPRGAFRSWLDDGMGEPFWQLVTGVETPPVVRYGIDQMDRSVRGAVLGGLREEDPYSLGEPGLAGNS